ncbi:MAG: hypothetical protein LBD93_01990 [Treponema sp.]|jgi:hypothetical protein|nr:hypothetical protein [Treponema sp.]
MKTSYRKLGWCGKGLIVAVVLGVTGIPAVQGEDIPTPWYVPESGTSKATLGALTNDIDNFMSVHAFRDVQIPTFMGFLGIDGNGLNLGYAQNIGPLYIGICYGGSLVDDLYRRFTNQDTNSVLKRDTETTTNSEDGEPKIDTKHDIVNPEGDIVPGTVISKNDVSVLLGFGNVGLKLGFSQYLQGTYDPAYDSKYRELFYNPYPPYNILAEPMGKSTRMQITQEFISGLRPYLEIGGKVNAGSFMLKPSLRAGFDIHQYSRKTPETSFIFTDPTGTADVNGTLHYIFNNDTSILGDYMEPSAGLTLGFDFTQDPRIRTELALDYDMAFRLYSNNKKDKVIETAYTELVNQVDQSQSISGTEEITEITKFYLTNHIVPTFKFSSDMGDRLTVGLVFGINIDFNIFKDTAVSYNSEIPDTLNEEAESNTQLFAVLPKLGLGLSLKLIPDHFFVNVGVGINVLKYEDKTVVAPEPDPKDSNKQIQTTTVSKTVTLPSTNLGAGLTFYFNQNVAADLLIMASGLGADVSDLLKFNFLVTMKY